MPAAPAAPPPAAVPAAAPAAAAVNTAIAPKPKLEAMFAKMESGYTKKSSATADNVSGVKPDASTQPKPGDAISPVSPGAPKEAPKEPVKPAEAPKPQAAKETPAVADPKAKLEDGKVSPWKLVDKYKADNARLQKEIAEAKTASLPAKEKAELTAKMEKIAARNAELEDEIRLHNYAKSEEFQTKFQKPYEKAWGRAISDLKEITFQDATTQQSRAMTPQDLMELVNMPLPKAREIADELFGNMANDVMAHRNEIRRLFDQQQEAIGEARKTAAEREKEQTALSEKTTSELNRTISETWQEANEEISQGEEAPFLVPKEGDAEHKAFLDRGYALVDKAWSENPMNPELSAEDRAEIVRRHAAVRHRAAAYGHLKNVVKTHLARIAELEAELGEYKQGEPKVAGRTAAPGVTPGGSAKERLFGALGNYVKK